MKSYIPTNSFTRKKETIWPSRSRFGCSSNNTLMSSLFSPSTFTTYCFFYFFLHFCSSLFMVTWSLLVSCKRKLLVHRICKTLVHRFLWIFHAKIGSCSIFLATFCAESLLQIETFRSFRYHHTALLRRRSKNASRFFEMQLIRNIYYGKLWQNNTWRQSLIKIANFM